MKEQEGRPEVKAKRRRRAIELGRSRNLEAVKRATVVVTNPSHYAVALSYQRATMSAPRVVAKGRDRLAQRIRLEAIRHGVPTVENPPLARELYRKVEVDRDVPPELYLAVAEVIAFVLRLDAAFAAEPGPAGAQA
jgi:flagellar biosynthetic protein FlhB